MNKKTKKRLIALSSLVIVLALCIGAFFILDNAKKQREKEESEDNISAVVAFDSNGAIVTELSFVMGEEDLSFVYENDIWYWSEDKDFPLDNEELSALALSMTHIEANLMVKDPNEDLSVYGFDKPALTAKAKYSDNSERTFLFGDISTYNNCQYFTLESSNEIYMLETTVSTAFGVDIDSLYDAETYRLFEDSVYMSKIESFTMTDQNGSTVEVTDDKGIEKLYDLVYSLDLTDMHDYYASEEEMISEYGISGKSRSIKVCYTVEITVTGENGNDKKSEMVKEYTVYIGNEFERAAEEEGKTEACYYYSPAGSTVVYAIPSATVNSIFEYSPS